MGVIWLAHRQLARFLPERDPYLFPVAAFLSGWGLLTIWRLSSVLALRQTAWLILVGMVFVLTLRYNRGQAGSKILAYLRRYKYVWLTSGLVLTAVTLFFGTNPLGSGPRLWLGCCGIYFQPSEPLKLLLVIYLAAYLADRQISSGTSRRLLPLLIPTLLMTGLALLLLIFQRDMGTAAIFMMLYAVIVYAGTGNKNVLFASLAILLFAAIAGYALFDVVKVRLDAWINPWLDPTGGSFQIVQSLMAVANGGLIGRGVGLGSPGLVPIAQSDFIFSAIVEESGLLGAIGILGLLALLVSRGMRLALKTEDTFMRLLAIGLVVHLVGQSILIIGGNLRLLPLTGVTLPFVSNGGSSLLVSFFELLCLLLISAQPVAAPASQPGHVKTLTSLNLLISAVLMIGLAGAALMAGWWSVVRAQDLLSRTDNPRRSIDDRYVLRGAFLDRNEHPLSDSSGAPGEIVRYYRYPALGPLLGYTDPAYGQAGLESSLDAYLRGRQGYPTLTMAWERLLYGQTPAGLNVRLSLDLKLQTAVDQLLAGHDGAVVLINAATGEVVAMASSPTFNANSLDANWQSLVNDPRSPLLNRATMGMYPAGNALGVFLLADSLHVATDPIENPNPAGCALIPGGNSWANSIAAGCSEPIRQLASSISSEGLIAQLDKLGFFTAPTFPVETLSSVKPEAITDAFTYITGMSPDLQSGNYLRVSPLQMALAAASLSNGGEKPVARLAMAVENPRGGWVMLPVNGQAQAALTPQSAAKVSDALADADLPIWQTVSGQKDQNAAGESAILNQGYTWYLGGTLPEWKGAQLAIAVLLEEDNPGKAQEIGRSIFQRALFP